MMQGGADLFGELTPKAVKPAAMPHATNRVRTQPEKICTVPKAGLARWGLHISSKFIGAHCQQRNRSDQSYCRVKILTV